MNTIRFGVAVIICGLLLDSAVLSVKAQTDVAPIAAGNVGREYPKSGLFTEGGAGDIARARTYAIRMMNDAWQDFDSKDLEKRLVEALDEQGFGASAVGNANDADLLLDVRIDPVAGEQGAGIEVGVMINPHRLTPTKHQLAYGFSGVAPTPEDVMTKFAKALTKGVGSARAGTPK